MVMMLYSVHLESAAERFIDRLRDAKLAKRLGEAINALRLDPRPPGCKKLSGRDGWRIRVGDYRIIYRIVDDKLVIVVVDIGDRKDVYR
jgi:mRNA interferase RelE/StbE